MTARHLKDLSVILIAFTVLTLIFFWPVLPHLSSALLGPPEDNLQDFWNSWYAVQKHANGFFFTRLLRAPEGVSLYYQSFAYPQIFAVWILSNTFGTSLSALLFLQNITILASFPLAGVSAYYLCRYFGCGAIGSAACGFIFSFNPWHIAQALHHTHVASIEFLPPFVLCYFLALERKSYCWLAGAILFCALSALSCWYYLFYCFYFLGFHILCLRVHEGRWPRQWPLKASALCVACTVLLLSPLLAPMVLIGLKGDAYRPGGGTFPSDFGGNEYVADILSYVIFPPAHVLGAWSTRIYAGLTGNAWEDGVYLGLVNLALLAWGFWHKNGGRPRYLWYAMGGMIFFAMLASGDQLHWGGRSLPIYMPNTMLSKLPFFANVRTPVRAIVFVYLFLGIAVGTSIATVMKRRMGLLKNAALAFALGLMVVDFFPMHLETTNMTCNPDLSVLTEDKSRDFSVLDLPFGYREENFYMAQQACHGRPITQGIVARQLSTTLADNLDVSNLAVMRHQLETSRVKYIILHRPRADMFVWIKQRDGDPDAYRKIYSTEAETPDETILRVY